MEASEELAGKHVVSYEDWVASENVTTVEIHKVTDDSDYLADSQMSNQDIFADIDDGTESASNAPGISESVDRTGSIGNKLRLDSGINESNASDSGILVESSDQQANNLFEKLGFGSALVEPSAEEKFDEMIRSSTPSTPPLKSSNDDLPLEPSDDTTLQEDILSNETEVLQVEGIGSTGIDSEVHILPMLPHPV